MRLTLLMLAMLSLGACSMHDTADIGIETPQASDLKDPDSVIEAWEHYTGTQRGAEVNNYGCSQIKASTEHWELEVLFPNDSEYLAPQYNAKLNSLAEFIRKPPYTRVTMAGYSGSGSDEHNMDLSQRSANSLNRALVQQFGADRSRLKAVSYDHRRQLENHDAPAAHHRYCRGIVGISGDEIAAEMPWNVYTVNQQ